MKYQDRLIAGLVALGYQQLPEGKKYATFKKPGSANKLFVGKAGALRVGLCASVSRSLGDPANQTTAYQKVLAAGVKA